MQTKSKVNGRRRNLLTALIGGTVCGIAPRLARATTTPAWLPIQMPDHRHVIVDGTINGVRARVMLDTGAGPLVLDKDFAARVAVAGAAEFKVNDMAGVAVGHTGAVVRLAIGPAILDALSATIFDLSGLNIAMPQPIHAIAGRDIFDRFALDIDFANTRLRFPETAEPASSATTIALGRHGSGLRTVELFIEGGAKISALLDSGADRALYISSAYAQAQGLLANRQTSTALSSGVAGTQLSTVAVIEVLTMGPATFHALPVEVPPAWTFDVPVIVGLPIIRRFSRLIFDFPQDRLIVPEDARQAQIAFRKDRTGLGVVLEDDHLLIVHVAERSPGALAGLRAGDQILAVNGIRCDRKYLTSHGRDGAGPSGTILHLTLKGGATTPLRLADYF